MNVPPEDEIWTQLVYGPRGRNGINDRSSLDSRTRKLSEVKYALYVVKVEYVVDAGFVLSPFPWSQERHRMPIADERLAHLHHVNAVGRPRRDNRSAEVNEIHPTTNGILGCLEKTTVRYDPNMPFQYGITMTRRYLLSGGFRAR
jgi:hypothetical protein